jgi:hypothetical protein
MAESARSPALPARPFLFDPLNDCFLEEPRSRRLPGVFHRGDRLSWVIALAVGAVLVGWALYRWHVTGLLAPPDGVADQARLVQVWRGDDDDAESYVKFEYAPSDGLVLQGEDSVPRTVAARLRPGDPIPICYASSKPTLSRASTNCKDQPLTETLLAVLWAAGCAVVILKDACLRRGRLVRGEIVAASTYEDEGHRVAKIQYRFATPGGRSVKGAIRLRRHDFDADPSNIPQAGAPLVVQYGFGFHRVL